MQTKITIEQLNNAFVVHDNDNNRIAEITYKFVNDSIIDINHTFVSPTLRGQGIAEELLNKVVTYAEENHLKIIPTCSYAVSKMKHEKYHHVLA